ncbi:MAG: NAD(P)H-hydrate dehydratase [Lachnospiraceae bacterium]
MPGKYYLVTGDEMRQADRDTSEKIGIPSLVLMERAALAAKEEITKRFSPCKVAILCGKGNNGADGLALARLLALSGYEAFPFALGSAKEGSSHALQQSILSHLGIQVLPYAEGSIKDVKPAVAVDALFGTGLSRAPEGMSLAGIRDINQAGEAGAFVVSLDVPSGISSDTGLLPGEAVRADLTVTFGFYKLGPMLDPARSYCGETIPADIGIPKSALDHRSVYTRSDKDLPLLLPSRQEGGNKGTFGKVVLAAGSRGMAGAALLCSEAAGRTGAGMVKVFTEEANREILQIKRPECLLSTYDPGDDAGTSAAFEAAMTWGDVIAAGPGMGKGPLKTHLVTSLLEYAATGPLRSNGQKKAFLLDADAVRIVAEENLYPLLQRAGAAAPVLLTPHLGEGAALLSCSVGDLKKDRFRLGAAFAKKYHVALLIKDAQSALFAPEEGEIYLNTSGTSALATAGSGDVLSGICASLLGQGLSAFSAGEAGSLLHAMAGKALEKKLGARGVLAGDLPAAAAEVLAEMEQERREAPAH